MPGVYHLCAPSNFQVCGNYNHLLAGRHLPLHKARFSLYSPQAMASASNSRVFVESDTTSAATSEQCGYVYWNLIELARRTDSASAELLVRELNETRRCDQFANMEALRGSVARRLGVPLLQSLLLYVALGSSDIKRLEQVMLHSRLRVRAEAVRALPWKSKLFYHLWGSPLFMG